MEINKLFNQIFQVPVVQGTTSGLANGCVWDNGRYFIEKQNRQYVVFDHGYFEVHSSKSKKDAVKWAEIKTATFSDDGGLL